MRESDVAQVVRGCYGCGNLVEGESAEACDVCGALAPEFEWFEPFYSRTPEHLGQRGPAEIVAILAGLPDAVAAAVAGRDDAALRRQPSAEEWCAKDIIAHILETELLLARRVRAILGHTGPDLAAIRTPCRPGSCTRAKGMPTCGRTPSWSACARRARSWWRWCAT